MTFRSCSGVAALRCGDDQRLQASCLGLIDRVACSSIVPSCSILFGMVGFGFVLFDSVQFCFVENGSRKNEKLQCVCQFVRSLLCSFALLSARFYVGLVVAVCMRLCAHGCVLVCFGACI